MENLIERGKSCNGDSQARGNSQDNLDVRVDSDGDPNVMGNLMGTLMQGGL